MRQAKAQIFSPADFVEQLSRDAFIPPVALTGWVKVEQEVSESLQFSPEQDCSAWITVPVSLVESVEYLGMAVCDDHRHPLVTLHIPPPADEQSKTLFLLLDTISTRAMRQARARNIKLRRDIRGFGPGCHACQNNCLQTAQSYDDLLDCSYRCFQHEC
jgi:hypothetical protein